LDTPVSPDTDLGWTAFLNLYGKVKPGISQIWLQNPNMTTDIVGTVAFNPSDDRLLIFDIDTATLPQDTLGPVDSVINPRNKYPDNGLPTVAMGQRYLVIDQIGGADVNPADSPWGSLIANPNDIIEYDGANWTVVFDSASSTRVEFVKNLTTMVQYRYQDSAWVKSYEGYYAPGDFSVVI
jgi:hypothetical protein